MRWDTAWKGGMGSHKMGFALDWMDAIRQDALGYNRTHWNVKKRWDRVGLNWTRQDVVAANTAFLSACIGS